MRLSWLKEGFSLILILSFSAFCLFDEEPVFDASDWNVLHCVLLLFSAMAVVWENTTRARYGQFVYKDQVLLFATFSFWFFLENYFRVVVIAFCLHSLVPLEAELIELVEVHQCLTRWINIAVLTPLLWLTLSIFFAILCNLSIGWARHQFILLLSICICLILLINIIFIGWDLVFASLTSANWFCDSDSFYIQTKSAITQDHYLNVQDQYDWHKDKMHPFVMRFEDLYMFFLQLFNLLSLTFCLIVWFSLTIDLAQLGLFGVSYTYFAVGIRWLEHTFWNFLLSYFSLFFISLRISLKTPLEFWFLT